MSQKGDPRTGQFWQVVLVNILFVILNTIALFRGWYLPDHQTGGFSLLVYCALPAMSSAFALVMRGSGRWHWGQVIFSLILALVFDFLTLIVVGALLVGGASPA